MTAVTSDKLREVYFNAQHPASFGGIERLAEATNLHPKNVKKWLSQHWTYTLHKPTRTRFPTRRYVSRGINYQWQADLIEMQHYAKLNDGNRYILCVIDIFSRYAYARPLKSKRGPDVAEALDDIFTSSGVVPNLLQTDQGLEFYNYHVRALLDKYKIKLFSVYSDKKAAIVERFQRTLKERMYRAFTYQGNHKWLELLPKVVHAYNHSYHRSIKNLPANVHKDNETDIWINQYSDLKKPSKPPKYKVGDHVRIPKKRSVFAKGYEEKWTDEEFIISAVNTKYYPPLYTLNALDGEVITGSFYEQELQLVENPEKEYRVERIIRTRMKNGRKQALIKWKGYKEPSWTDYTNIRRM